MKQSIALVAVLVLAGCATTTATPMRTADGKDRYYVDCKRSGMAKCIEKANELCSNGYTVDNQAQRTGWSVNRWGGGSSTESAMQVTCK